MNFVVEQRVEPVALRAWVEGRMIFMELTDGRVFGFSVERSRRLRAASVAELAEVTVSPMGRGLRWESIDEDIRVGAVVDGFFELPLRDEAA